MCASPCNQNSSGTPFAKAPSSMVQRSLQEQSERPAQPEAGSYTKQIRRCILLSQGIPPGMPINRSAERLITH